MPGQIAQEGHSLFPARVEANRSSPKGKLDRLAILNGEAMDTGITLDQREKERNKPNFAEPACTQ